MSPSSRDSSPRDWCRRSHSISPGKSPRPIRSAGVHPPDLIRQPLEAPPEISYRPVETSTYHATTADTSGGPESA
jgi:hypothetical protein